MKTPIFFIISAFFVLLFPAYLLANSADNLVLIPTGEFQMGDHFGEGGSRERPLHQVIVDSFLIGRYEVTNLEYCDALNWALAQGLIYVNGGKVFGVGNNQLYCYTRVYISQSQITWNGSSFSVVSGKENHPMTTVTWYGSAAYCNWRSQQLGLQPCYNLSTWTCDFTKNGFRLPTESEWEFAARGGLSCKRFPWGDSISPSQANYWQSGDPFESGGGPLITPVGFYNGALHKKATFNWPGSVTTYQTENGVNGYGIYDLAGNVWEWCNDWCSDTYYSISPYYNPTGPSSGSYRVLRGGSWDGEIYHCRVACRYYCLPDDPYINGGVSDGGFRIIRRVSGPSGTCDGIIYDSKTGNPIEGAIVSVPGKVSTQTGPNGRFSFTGVPCGPIMITVTKTGYYVASQTVNVGGGTGFVNIAMVPQAVGATLVIGQIEGRFFGPVIHTYYLGGPSVIETITATIDWKGKTPSQVKWLLPNGSTYTDSVSGNTCSRIFDMGNIGPGKLTLTAIAADSSCSAPKQANFDVIIPPPGVPPAALRADISGSTLSYSAKWILDAINEGVEEDEIDEDIPGFGGRSFEFIIKPLLEAKITPDGTAKATILEDYELPSFDIASVEMEPQATVQLGWQYSSEQQKWIPSGYIEVSVQGSYAAPPSYYVIMVGPVPIPIYWRCALETSLAVKLALGGWFGNDAMWKGTIPFNIYAEIMLGVGIADVLAAEGYLGGGANMLLEFPNEKPLRELTIELNGGIRLVALIWKYENNLLHYEWCLVDGKAAGAAFIPMTIPKAGEFQIMNRDYLGPDYAVWAPTIPQKPKHLTTFGVEAQSPPEPNEEQLRQYKVFPQSQPTLAADGNDLLLAWIYDDPNRDPGDPNSVNRTKLLFSSCRHGNWAQPISINDDGTADFSPQLVTLPDGDALCVWENARQSLPNDVNLTEMAAAMEIKAAHYGAVSQTWTAQTLTNNNHLDRSPRIATADNGTAVAVWIYNAKDDILGLDSNTLNEIEYSAFNGSTWSEPNTVATDIGLIIKTDLAYNGSESVYVYSLDTDHNWQTDSDRELYAIIYNGSTWSQPYQITDDNCLDANPQVVYDQNDIFLVWYHDANLVSCRNFDANTFQQILTTSGSSGSMDFRLAKSPAGQISLVWTDTSAAGVDIFTASFDPQLSVWSNAYQLTSDRSMERSITATYAGLNELALAYNKVEIIDHNGIPEPNRVDLYILRHKIKGDLATSSGDISFSVPNPSPGSIVDINAVIHNLGDIAEVNVPVSFYNGDPDVNGILIKNTIVPGPIPAHSTATASISWLVPDTNEPQQIYVVIDRQFTLEDADRSNNIVSVPVLAPDLTVAGITSERIGPKLRCITARIANSGTLPAHNIGVSLRRGSLTGQTLATFNIPELKPGSFYDVWHNWNITGIDFNDVEVPVYAIADYANTIAEFNENNNIALILVQVGKSSDLTDDGRIDFTDFAVLADSWKNSQADFSDLAKLAEDWLWQASW